MRARRPRLRRGSAPASANRLILISSGTGRLVRGAAEAAVRCAPASTCQGGHDPSPTTVVHFRTPQRVTSPLVTYASALAKSSTSWEEGPRNTSTAPSTGSARAPARTTSPRSNACHVIEMPIPKLGSPAHVVVDNFAEEEIGRSRSPLRPYPIRSTHRWASGRGPS